MFENGGMYGSDILYIELRGRNCRNHQYNSAGDLDLKKALDRRENTPNTFLCRQPDTGWDGFPWIWKVRVCRGHKSSLSFCTSGGGPTTRLTCGDFTAPLRSILHGYSADLETATMARILTVGKVVQFLRPSLDMHTSYP